MHITLKFLTGLLLILNLFTRISTFVSASTNFSCPLGGYYCLNEKKYAWCNEDDISAQPTIWECASGPICSCGFAVGDAGPCAWAYSDLVNVSCTGTSIPLKP